MKQVTVRAPVDRMLSYLRDNGTRLSQVDPEMVQFRVDYPCSAKGVNVHRIIVSVCKGQVYASGSIDEAVDAFASGLAVSPPVEEPAPEPIPTPKPKSKKKSTKSSKPSGSK